MARVTFVDAIDTVRGALDEVKDGQANRARLVCKWHYWGEKWIDEDGSKVHLVYTYHFRRRRLFVCTSLNNYRSLIEWLTAMADFITWYNLYHETPISSFNL